MLSSNLIYQKEENDCGIACLASIFSYCNIRYSDEKLWSQFAGKDEGISFKEIIEVSEKYGLGCDCYEADIDDLQTISRKCFPIIAHIVQRGSYHFVIVEKIKKKVLLFDPSLGEYNLPIEDFKKIWTGNIVIFHYGHRFKLPKLSLRYVNKYENLISRNLLLLISILLYSIGISAFTFLSTLLYKYLIDYYILGNSHIDLLRENLIIYTINWLANHGISIFLYIFLVYFQKNILIFGKDLLTIRLMKKVEYALYKTFVKNILNYGKSFITRRSVGEVLSLTKDLENVQQGIYQIYVTMIYNILLLLFGIGLLFYFGSLLAKYVLFSAFIYVVIVIVMLSPIRRANTFILKKYSELVSSLQDLVSGRNDISSADTRGYFHNLLGKKIYGFVNSNYNTAKLLIFYDSLLNITQDIVQVIIIWRGTIFILDGSLSVGEFIVFQSILIYFWNPLLGILNLQEQFQRMNISVNRLKQLEKYDYNSNKEIENVNKIVKVEFNNLKCARSNVNLSESYYEGDCIAVIGNSGVGKTTLLKMIKGDIPVLGNGDIFLNNKRIEVIDRHQLERKIGMIYSDSYLFEGSILDNIILGRENISFLLNRVLEDFLIDGFPGYNLDSIKQYYITGNGENISAGQRQRILLCRVLIDIPDILLLDESTSHLDAKSEIVVLDRIFKYCQNSIIFIVSHNSIVQERCNKILHL